VRALIPPFSIWVTYCFVEWHLDRVQVGHMLFVNPPEPKNGILTISGAPGLGLTLNREALRKSEVVA